MLLLDTDVLIDVQRNYLPAVDWFSQQRELPSIPGFVVMELVQDAQNSQQVAKVLKLVEPLPRVWPSPADCEVALELFREHHLARGLGLLDSVIAACALGHNATLCTFNLKHYRSVAGLQSLQPYSK